MSYGKDDEDRIYYGVEGGRETGILNTVKSESWKLIGTCDEVKAKGQIVGRSATLWVLDDPVTTTTYSETSPVIAGPSLIEEFIRRDNERLAQESRARFRHNLLDSVSEKAFRNIRR